MYEVVSQFEIQSLDTCRLSALRLKSSTPPVLHTSRLFYAVIHDHKWQEPRWFWLLRSISFPSVPFLSGTPVSVFIYKESFFAFWTCVEFSTSLLHDRIRIGRAEACDHEALERVVKSNESSFPIQVVCLNLDQTVVNYLQREHRIFQFIGGKENCAHNPSPVLGETKGGVNGYLGGFTTTQQHLSPRSSRETISPSKRRQHMTDYFFIRLFPGRPPSALT